MLKDKVEYEIIVEGVPEIVEVEIPFYYIEPERGKGINLDTRAELGLRLFASGYTMVEAAKIAKTKPLRIRRLMQTDAGQQTLKNIRLELDEEFKALYRESIEALRQGLDSKDLRVKMDAADKYLKYAKDLRVNLVLTAEDLIRKIRDGVLDD